jgi:hypothetical protein
MPARVGNSELQVHWYRHDYELHKLQQGSVTEHLEFNGHFD